MTTSSHQENGKCLRRDHRKNHHHHHHVVPLVRISLTLSRHFSLSFIASGRSSGLHPVSWHSYCMYIRAGRPAFARPYVEVYRSTSLMSSSLLLQQCPACLIRLTLIVFMMGGRWPFSRCFVGCCCLELFNIARNIKYNSLYIGVSSSFWTSLKNSSPANGVQNMLSVLRPPPVGVKLT